MAPTLNTDERDELERLRAVAHLCCNKQGELRKDAMRYRWLRERPSLIGWDWWNPPVPQEVLITPEFMDAAIDSELNRVIEGNADG